LRDTLRPPTADVPRLKRHDVQLSMKVHVSVRLRCVAEKVFTTRLHSPHIGGTDTCRHAKGILQATQPRRSRVFEDLDFELADPPQDDGEDLPWNDWVEIPPVHLERLGQEGPARTDDPAFRKFRFLLKINPHETGA
jgi:hypothetical protein